MKKAAQAGSGSNIHTIPHSLDVYRRAFLNLTVGKRYFKKHVAGKRPKAKFIVVSFDPDHTNDIKRIPALLDTLKKHKIKCSFAAVGAWVEKYPEIWKRVVREGHEIINHTYSHPDSVELNPRHYNDLTRAERLQEIKKCHDTVKRVLGVSMKGFRSPHFGHQHTRDTYSILEELGYKFSSSAVAMDSPSLGQPFTVGKITEFPLSYCPKHPWALFDSSHAFRGRITKHSNGDFLRTFEELIESGAYLNIYLDPIDFDKYDFEDLLKLIKKHKLATKVYGELL